MDFRVKCYLLFLGILGCSTHVTSQDAASPAAISQSHASNAGDHATTGVPGKLPVPGTDGGKEVSTIKHVHDSSPGVLGMQAAHTTHPTPDLKHGAGGIKMIPVAQSKDATTVGVFGKKEDHTLHPGHGSSPGAGGIKMIPVAQSKDATTVGVIGKKEDPTLHPGHGSSPGAGGIKMIPVAQSKDATTVGAIGKKEDRTLHPGPGSPSGAFGDKKIPPAQSMDATTVGAIGKKKTHTLHPGPDSTFGILGGLVIHVSKPSPDAVVARDTTTSHHSFPDKAIISEVDESHQLLAHPKAHRPKHLISRIIRPPTVDPVVLQNDYIILCVCAPGIVFWLIVLVIVTIRRKKKGKA